MDREGKLDSKVLSELFKNGLMGIEVPMKYGGSELSFTSVCIAVEALAETDPGVSIVCDVQNTLLNNVMMTYGNEEQQQVWLPRLANNTVGAFCLSEVGSGSDAFALSTTAKQNGNEKWIFQGRKMWISNAEEAGMFLVFANTDLSKGYKGITAFILDRERIERDGHNMIGKREEKLGIRASSCCEVVLDDIEVTSDDIVGGVGNGYKIAIGALNEGRIGIAAQMVGLAKGAFDVAVKYCWERKQFGKPVAEFQGMQFQFARAATQIEASRTLLYNAARLKDAGLPYIREAAFAKLHASETAGQIASTCVDWAGGVGYSKEYPMEKFFRDAKVGTIYEGTSNMQLVTIAKMLERDYGPS